MILVVDDEPSILQCIRRILEQANYTVMTSPNGDQAWGVIERDQAKIVLVLTDIVMPGSIDGLTLAAKISQRDRKLPVLFMTGALPENDVYASGDCQKKAAATKTVFPKAAGRVHRFAFPCCRILTPAVRD